MLAVTANWRLSDGSLTAPRCRAARDWLGVIHRAAIRAGVGRDGRYRPVDAVCLVFAGDTFEWLVSDTWAGRDRPWHGGRRGREARERAALAALRAARPALRLLGRWLRRGLEIPAADARGRPSADRSSRAPTQIAMLAGDRDSWLTEIAALAGRSGVLVGDSWADESVLIRHGHEFDAACQRSGDRTGDRPPSLAESVLVDLVVPFAVRLRDDLPAWRAGRACVSALSGSALSELPRVVTTLGSVPGGDLRATRRVMLAWRRSVAAWAAAARRDPPACDVEFDLVAAVAGWLETAWQEGGAAPTIPAPLSGLDCRRPSREDAGSVLGHPASGGRTIGLGDPFGGPHLAVVHRAAGPGWRESLGPPPPGTGVVTIGFPVAGQPIVDAA